MRRWLVLPIALGLAAAAAYVLLTGLPPVPVSETNPVAHHEIRDASRDQLREILREADSKTARTK